MIQFFLNSDKQFGIFCEDDIVINRTLPQNLPYIMSECTEMGTECLLLGYMKTYKVEGWMSGHETIRAFPGRPYTYHAYPNDQWGVHLYMLSRSGAKKILDTYSYNTTNPSDDTRNTSYADTNMNDPNRPFSPDWTITKCPGLKRALISPMFACEDGRDTYDHYAHDGQYNFHMETFRFNYVPNLFI
jgi:GR25 family glycosyltransferase involved in LPS biosynthesis